MAPPSSSASEANSSSLLISSPPQSSSSSAAATTSTTGQLKLPATTFTFQLDSCLYSAGTLLKGRLLVAADKRYCVSVGNATLRLAGEEAVNYKSFKESKPLLAQTLHLEDDVDGEPEFVPLSSTATSPGTPTSPNPARQQGRRFGAPIHGTQAIPFTFRLPATLPSSFEHNSHASISYTLTCTVEVQKNGQRSVGTFSRKVFVTERKLIDEERQAVIARMPPTTKAGHKIESKAITVEISLTKPIQYSPSMAFCKIYVNNRSRRTLDTLKVSVTRVLSLHDRTGRVRKDFTEVKWKQTYRDNDITFEPLDARSHTLPIHIPDDMSSIVQTALIRSQCFLIVELGSGNMRTVAQVIMPIIVQPSIAADRHPPTIIARGTLKSIPSIRTLRGMRSISSMASSSTNAQDDSYVHHNSSIMSNEPLSPSADTSKISHFHESQRDSAPHNIKFNSRGKSGTKSILKQRSANRRSIRGLQWDRPGSSTSGSQRSSIRKRGSVMDMYNKSVAAASAAPSAGSVSASTPVATPLTPISPISPVSHHPQRRQPVPISPIRASTPTSVQHQPALAPVREAPAQSSTQKSVGSPVPSGSIGPSLGIQSLADLFAQHNLDNDSASVITAASRDYSRTLDNSATVVNNEAFDTTAMEDVTGVSLFGETFNGGNPERPASPTPSDDSATDTLTLHQRLRLGRVHSTSHDASFASLGGGGDDFSGTQAGNTTATNSNVSGSINNSSSSFVNESALPPFFAQPSGQMRVTSPLSRQSPLLPPSSSSPNTPRMPSSPTAVQAPVPAPAPVAQSPQVGKNKEQRISRGKRASIPFAWTQPSPSSTPTMGPFVPDMHANPMPATQAVAPAAITTTTTSTASGDMYHFQPIFHAPPPPPAIAANVIQMQQQEQEHQLHIQPMPLDSPDMLYRQADPRRASIAANEQYYAQMLDASPGGLPAMTHASNATTAATGLGVHQHLGLGSAGAGAPSQEEMFKLAKEVYGGLRQMNASFEKGILGGADHFIDSIRRRLHDLGVDNPFVSHPAESAQQLHSSQGLHSSGDATASTTFVQQPHHVGFPSGWDHTPASTSAADAMTGQLSSVPPLPGTENAVALAHQHHNSTSHLDSVSSDAFMPGGWLDGSFSVDGMHAGAQAHQHHHASAAVAAVAGHHGRTSVISLQ
ncbi:hypothetical protein RI367_004931 [Sorochytrium milnesiophthora]